MSIGRKIASGWEAEIYEWSDGTSPKVLKLYWGHHGSQPGIERDITYTVNSAGGLAPEVFGETIEVDGRIGFIMERVRGQDMDALIAKHFYNKRRLDDIGRQLGHAHAAMHRKTGIQLRRTLKQLSASSIDRTSAITQSEKEMAIRMLEELPDGDSLCHRDFHFANVITSDGGPVVIDWGNAGMGDPMADVAKAQLLITSSWIGNSLTDILLSGLVRRIKERLNRSYTEAYFSSSDRSPADVDKWRTVIAAARLGDGLPRSQEKHVVKLVREGLTQSGSRC